jgi:hypothetical protein
LKRNYSGCAICNSTWGNVWEEVEGDRMFFCCSLCVVQFRRLLDRVKTDTGWSTVDGIEISGDRRGRACAATTGGKTIRFRFSFNPEGDLLRFEKVLPE